MLYCCKCNKLANWSERNNKSVYYCTSCAQENVNSLIKNNIVPDDTIVRDIYNFEPNPKDSQIHTDLDTGVVTIVN